MQKVIIYSTPTCTYCKHVKEYLKEKNISYEEHDVAGDADKRKEMVEKSGQLGVPVTDVDGKIIVGFDKEELDKTFGA